MRDVCICGTILLSLCQLTGCLGGPAAIPAPDIRPKQASSKAFELHDEDDDGILSSKELEASPGLAYAAERADDDGDGGLSKSEIEAMVEAWREESVGLMTLRCNVTVGRRALAGATITLEPEPFLEGKIEPAFGLTDEFGDAYLTVPKEKRPVPDSPPGVQLGIYRVKISKKENGRETISAKYNSETTLGQEVAFGDPGVANGITYALKK